MGIGRVAESGALQDFKEDAEIARRWVSSAVAVSRPEGLCWFRGADVI